MYIVLCDRCGNEIRTSDQSKKPVFPWYRVLKTDLTPPDGLHLTTDVTLCPVCRDQLKAFLCCADRRPVTETLRRQRAIRRARMRDAMEGAYYAETRT